MRFNFARPGMAGPKREDRPYISTTMYWDKAEELADNISELLYPEESAIAEFYQGLKRILDDGDSTDQGNGT